ncbi:SCO family protein [Nitrosomonas sp. Is37]|uniref:SCO family protein n=1 Tax=Nitrosomonas sp. Is37 TaxID=3080535 RepID=UPI00294AD951|nr:SCO family protein [Nitrosomonas sp. Is37]MDV6345392.1 SCO family protein [Nitrosomonas sp. Is37]
MIFQKKNKTWILTIAVILTWAMGAMMFSVHALSHDGKNSNTLRTVVGTPSSSRYTVTNAQYHIPALGFLSNTGQEIQIDQLLAQPRPVMLQFIYTTCSTTCPVLSATFSKAQNRLSEISKDYLLISISIDPEYDSLQQLSDYAKRYNAGKNWIFLTGNNEATRSLMKAFGALYPGSNKMNHLTYTFLRAHPDAQWSRIEGFLSVDELMSHFSKLVIERGI